ncbi:MAG: UDP-N-acetylmuramoyl-L-alanine--D-glutamate ligase [Trueperaceae bacterium]|nr:MAG: UDP-N-acetylmuramoyl-L-alanine--D-glutamate ligase [Trueperaceae bacterium]
MKVLIYGLGRSGLPVLRLCHDQQHELLFFEARAEGADIEEAIQLGAERITTVAGVPCDLCIAAPGVPFDHPDLATLRSEGVETIGEIEWVYRSTENRIIGVSGTAGKSTTTLWISEAFKRAGHDAPAGGNIDPALSAVVRPGALLVAELSSFQLERSPTLRCRTAVLLNLGSDHLDRHGSLACYHAAKRRLVDNLTDEDLLVFNYDDDKVSRWASECRADTRSFSLSRRADACLDRNGTTLILDGTPLLDRSELSLKGDHQVANALATALVCRHYGLSVPEIQTALRGFTGLPGRYSEVRTLGGISFIEDSIATRELAVRAALHTTQPPIVWIGGGADKGADPSSLRSLILEKVTLFIGIGASGAQLADAVKDWTEVFVCPQRSGEAALRCAVTAATSHLQNHHKGRGTVLLAPLAASFDQFNDYAHRAAVFRQTVELQERQWTHS